MKTVTIRDLRLRWPATERALELERELLVTRDGKPVAKLVRIRGNTRKRKPWDPEKHKRWLSDFWGGREVSLVTKYLEPDRAERDFKRQ